MNSIVALVKGERGHEPVFKALDLIDFKSALAGYNRVLIKVNFITTNTWDSGATTDPMVVEAIILRLKTLPIKIFVVESDSSKTNANKANEKTGMKEMCERNSVDFINLRHEKDKVTLGITNGETLKGITVPRIVCESAIISAAKLKTNPPTTVTLGMKNLFGLIPDKLKIKYHMNDMNKVIVDINTVIRPALTVIDGFVGMEGKGPWKGPPVKMDLIIAGNNAVAADAIGAKVMGFDPNNIYHIKIAADKGLGNLDSIEILGAKIEEVKRMFKLN